MAVMLWHSVITIMMMTLRRMAEWRLAYVTAATLMMRLWEHFLHPDCAGRKVLPHFKMRWMGYPVCVAVVCLE